MLARTSKVTAAILLCAAISASVGCACGGSRTACAQETPVKLTAERFEAEPGECFAMVYIPPKFETVSEQVCVREASSRLEVVPAEFAWVEERVLVKDAVTEIHLNPAQFRTKEVTVQVEPGSRGWVRHENTPCAETNQRTADVYCLEDRPAQFKTVSYQEVAQDAHYQEVTIPAEYQTVRRHKVVRPATTRKVTIPAEFETVQKRVQTAAGKMDWQKVMCEQSLTTNNVMAIERALVTAGYRPGTPNGHLEQTDWAAIRRFQEDHGIGSGALTVRTLDELGVTLD